MKITYHAKHPTRGSIHGEFNVRVSSLANIERRIALETGWPVRDVCAMENGSLTLGLPKSFPYQGSFTIHQNTK